MSFSKLLSRHSMVERQLRKSQNGYPNTGSPCARSTGVFGTGRTPSSRTISGPLALKADSSMKQRVVIVSGFPLSGTPRVVKEATALADAGYEVEVLTSILDPNHAENELARA